MQHSNVVIMIYIQNGGSIMKKTVYNPLHSVAEMLNYTVKIIIQQETM